jgi:aryl-alcohol dehydrogenase-like predicted oxidoreductase
MMLTLHSITDPSHFANDIRGTWPRYQAENFDANQRIVQQFGDLAKQKGVLPSQLAIAWVMSQGAIPIPGTRSAERVEENDKAGDIELSDEDLAAIRKVVEESKPQGDRYGELHMSLVGR